MNGSETMTISYEERERRAKVAASAISDDLNGINPRRELNELREAVIDLLAVLDSPHTSVSARWECGTQYAQAKMKLRALVRDRK